MQTNVKRSRSVRATHPEWPLDPTILSRNLNTLISIYNYSVAELCAVTAVSAPTFNTYRQDARRMRLEHVNAIAQLTGFTAQKLLFERIE